MAQLKAREKRTIWIGTIGIALYLLLFYGQGAWTYLNSTQQEYQQLRTKARNIEEEFRAYQEKVTLLNELSEQVHAEPSEFKRESLAGDVNAAIQQAAKKSGIELGPIRESPGDPSDPRLASMKVQGSGKIESVIQLLHRIQTLAFPLIVNQVQITADMKKRNKVELALTVIVLDFQQWKEEQTEERENV